MRGVVFFISLLLIGCSSSPNEKAIKKIDSLLVQANKASVQLSEFNPADVKPLVDTINFDVKFIQQEYSDTMTMELATKIDTYLRNVKSIRKFDEAYNAQRKDVDYSIDQLSDMKADLESGIMDSTGFNMYIGSEEEALNRMIESNVGLKTWFENIQETFKAYKLPIDSIILEIKEQNGY
ncbi:MAG: hypothetical protein ACPGEG_03625 [Salibacteraceae bacterium]